MSDTLRNLSIKTLYTPALAEGEGVGTAYEYFAKRLVLDQWLRQLPRQLPLIRRVLIAGLPEKYGVSLDFLVLAAEVGATAVVVDERPAALARFQQSLTAVQQQGWLYTMEPQIVQVNALSQLDELSGSFDLALSSEVLQRLVVAERPLYVARLRQLAGVVALFCPNADNPAHTNLSGLAGLSLDELQTLTDPAAHTGYALRTGYIDMPPFPPGIVRDEAQREQASSGLLEATAMRGLAYYARMEKRLPTAVRQRQSHIVYALLS